MAQGTIKWFDETRGYGFIKRQDGPDLFVHLSDVLLLGDGGEQLLRTGDRVEFQVAVGPRGPQAAQVRRLQPSL
jgi:CspA family cold shock protein